LANSQQPKAKKMKRREFIKKAGLATAGAYAVPYILPSGRLFAASGIRKVNHVVFCMFAGGVRNLESVDKSLGNLMPNMLSGNEMVAPDIALAISASAPPAFSLPLQSKGTLFKEFRYKKGPTGHFNGHTTAITGSYTTADLNIKDHPHTPTIFEYYRKHNSPAQTAKKCWWVSNTLGPYPALNFSSFAGYGAEFGANFIAPTAMFSFDQNGYNPVSNVMNFSDPDDKIGKIRSFMNHNFNRQFVNGDAGVTNTADDAFAIQSWIDSMFALYASGGFNQPWGPGAYNNDMMNIFFAEKIIEAFKPELLVVNMQDVDVAHFNFTNYAVNLHKADMAVAHLWNKIQSTPEMMDDTVMIIAPEHGRNQITNSSIDLNGRAALDHTAALDEITGDQMAREIFCQVLGPPSIVRQGQVISGTSGESIDVAAAIANLLGFDSQMPSGMLRSFTDTGIQQAFL
jgi:hypothetical protein